MINYIYILYLHFKSPPHLVIHSRRKQVSDLLVQKMYKKKNMKKEKKLNKRLVSLLKMSIFDWSSRFVLRQINLLVSPCGIQLQRG